MDELLLRADVDEETKDYLAKKSTAETIRDSGSEEVKGDGVLEEMEREAEAAENPSVRKQAAEVERLRHLNEMVRSVNQAVVEADSREELGRKVCREFVDGLIYDYAVMGEYASNHDELLPSASSDGESELEPVKYTDGGPVDASLDGDTVETASESTPTVTASSLVVAALPLAPISDAPG